MNHPLHDPRHPWQRLNSAARQAQRDEDVSAPYGFATRVTALAFAQEAAIVSLFDRFALRALGVACLLALGSVALNYRALTTSNAITPSVVVAFEDDVLPATDAVALVLDIAD